MLMGTQSVVDTQTIMTLIIPVNENNYHYPSSLVEAAIGAASHNVHGPQSRAFNDGK